MIERNKKYKTIVITIFVLYSLLMIWLLFGQRANFYREGTYIEQLSRNYNIIPFYTSSEYVLKLFSGKLDDAGSAIINLAGNIIMFIPLGFLLPLAFRRINSPLKCLLWTSLIIITVEIVQLFTLMGVCDIDDLILNICGSMIGYFIMRRVKLNLLVNKNSLIKKN